MSNKELPILNGTLNQRFLQAALNMGLDKNVIQAMLQPTEIIQGVIPLNLNVNGTVVQFMVPHARMVMNLGGGYHFSQGGVKIDYATGMLGHYEGVTIKHPYDMSLLTDLTLAMSFKHLVTGTGYNGAKAIVQLPNLVKWNRETIDRAVTISLRKLGRDFWCQILGRGGVGPDTRTGGGKMDELVTGLTMNKGQPGSHALSLEQARCVVTGKSIANGGLELREKSTGIGVGMAVEYIINKLRTLGKLLSPKDERIGFQAAGAVGSAAIEHLLKEGYKITIFTNLGSDGKSHGFLCPDGISLDLFHEAMVGGVIDVANPRISEYLVEPELLFSKHVNILVPCWKERAVSAGDLRKIPNLLGIAEGANFPLTPDAAEYAENLGIEYHIGEITNSIGVGMSTLERQANSPSLDEQYQFLYGIRNNINKYIAESTEAFRGMPLSSSLIYMFVQRAYSSRVESINNSRTIISID